MAQDTSKAVVTAGFQTHEGFNLIQRVAKLFAHSNMVPAQYLGDNNVPNCVIALNMAQRMNVDPLMVMQNLYIVHGKPAWSTQFLISMFNACGKFEPIRYRQTGVKGTDSQGVIAFTVDKSTGDIIEGEEVTMAIAKSEGWTSKSGSKWKNMPGLMLRYRAAAWLIRTTAPELSLGLSTREEAVDLFASQRPLTKSSETFKTVDADTGEIIHSDSPLLETLDSSEPMKADTGEIESSSTEPTIDEIWLQSENKAGV